MMQLDKMTKVLLTVTVPVVEAIVQRIANAERRT